MKFGDVPLTEAEGAILAHSIRLPGVALKKGRTLAREDIAALRAAGRDRVVAARLEPDELAENEAAGRIGAACAGDNVRLEASFAGRSNLRAAARGVAVIDERRVERINLIDEAATLATLRPYEPVERGQIVATAKIIAFGVPLGVVETCLSIAAETSGVVRVAAFEKMTVGLIQTRLPGLKESLIAKMVETTRARLAAVEAAPGPELRCAHDEDSVAGALRQLAAAGCDVALVLGASAIVDRRDVVPLAIGRAGGVVEHFGMPVDPGNLTLLARCGDMRVLGVPGSARSPRLHGFDWVLQRICARLPVTGRDVMRMGVGGLLKEIPSRPLPRDDAGRQRREGGAARVAAVILAAGRSRRMGARNKLAAEIEGIPMVVRTADSVLASRADPVLVVVGHEADRIRAMVGARPVTIVDNPDYAQGLSSSLRRAIVALPGDVDGVLVCLADMPDVTPAHIDRLIAAFDPAAQRAICVPTFRGKRGNPVLWGRQFFAEMADVAGDVGARHLIGAHADALCEVAMPDDGVLMDIDTPDALADRRAASSDTPVRPRGAS